MLQDGASTVHCGASKLWRTIGNLGANRRALDTHLL